MTNDTPEPEPQPEDTVPTTFSDEHDPNGDESRDEPHDDFESFDGDEYSEEVEIIYFEGDLEEFLSQQTEGCGIEEVEESEVQLTADRYDFLSVPPTATDGFVVRDHREYIEVTEMLIESFSMLDPADLVSNFRWIFDVTTLSYRYDEEGRGTKSPERMQDAMTAMAYLVLMLITNANDTAALNGRVVDHYVDSVLPDLRGEPFALMPSPEAMHALIDSVAEALGVCEEGDESEACEEMNYPNVWSQACVVTDECAREFFDEEWARQALSAIWEIDDNELWEFIDGADRDLDLGSAASSGNESAGDAPAIAPETP